MSGSVDIAPEEAQTHDHGHRSGRSPPSALESAQAHLPPTARADGAESPGERDPLRRIQAQALLESSRYAGFHFDHGTPCGWFEILNDAQVAQGREHLTWHGKDAKSIFKFTYPDKFGRTPFYCSGGLGSCDATPFEYLTRLALHNDLFGDDILIEATLHDERHRLIVVTSQTFIVGDHPTPAEIDTYMQAEGFIKTRSEDWYRPQDDLGIFDTHPGNYIRTPAGNIIPIDLVPLRHPDAEHLRMMGVYPPIH